MSNNTVTIAPIERYLAALWERGGSDLLITAFSPPLMRIDGQLIPIPDEPELDQEHVEQLVIGVLNEDLKTELRDEKEVDFSFTYKHTHRFRGNAFVTQGVLAMALRSIPLAIPTPEELRLPPVLSAICELPQGFVLVTGPTGSGKSTTLASLIDYINERRPVHILTIEDPIEYVHRHKVAAVNQREVGLDTNSFPRASRAAFAGRPRRHSRRRDA